MSEPASAYSYSAYTIAPSEASLNARWYNQIQQWTHDLPPDSKANTGSTYLHHRNTIVSQGHPGEEDVATEHGTVLPAQSVSRRASLAERRQWEERQGEFARTTALQGALSNIDKAKVEAQLPGHKNDRRSIVRDETPALNQKAALESAYTVLLPAQKMHDLANPGTVPSSAGHSPIRTHKSKTNKVEVVQVKDLEGAPKQQPFRGRRPPTPYHPPSNLALTELTEGSEEGDRVNKSGPAPFQPKVTESLTGTDLKPLIRYPSPVLRKALPSTGIETHASPAVVHRPRSHISAGSERTYDHSLPPQKASQRVALSSNPPTDYSSFPPLPIDSRDMTIVPEDSISRVDPPHHVVRERYERRYQKGPRGRSPYRRIDQDRRREHTRSRRRSSQHSVSDIDSDSTSMTSDSRFSSADSSSSDIGAYRGQTSSPTLPLRRPSLIIPPLRMVSPPISGIRPSLTAKYSHMTQLLPTSPISPLTSSIRPLHLNAPLSDQQWSIPSSFSSISLPNHASMHARWTAFGGTPARMGLHHYRPQMQPHLSGLSRQTSQLGGNSRHGRGSAISAGAMPVPTAAGLRRPPSSSPSASIPLRVGVSSSGIEKERTIKRFRNKPTQAISPRLVPVAWKAPMPDSRTRQGPVKNSPRRAENHSVNQVPTSAMRVPSSGSRQQTSKPIVRSTPTRAVSRVKPQGTGRSQGPAQTFAAPDQRSRRMNGGKGLGWMKGLLPPYGRPSN